MAGIDPYDIATRYGVQFDGTLVTGEYHDTVEHGHNYTLAELAEVGGKITRVRVLTGNWGGRWFGDISYIHATLADGKVVPVSLSYLPASTGIPMLHKGSRGLKKAFIEWAKEEKVFAKDLGLLDESNYSILWG